jgi:tankyrase
MAAEEAMREALDAARLGAADALRRLLAQDRDAVLRARSAAGWTCLHWAAGYGRRECLELLLAAGADKDARDSDGNAPLHRAVAENQAACIALLLRAGADKNAADADGWTPLHRAARWGNLESVRLLLQAGADAAARTSRECDGLAAGSTPLDVAEEDEIKAALKGGAPAAPPAASAAPQ